MHHLDLFLPFLKPSLPQNLNPEGGQLQSLQECNTRVLVEQAMVLIAAAVPKLKLAFIISSHHQYRFPSLISQHFGWCRVVAWWGDLHPNGSEP